jgi:hypothetical protein
MYQGSSTYISASGDSELILEKSPTGTTLTASPMTVTPPAIASLTATVTRTATGAAGTPAGTVKFLYAGNIIGTVKVDGSGVATLIAPSDGIPAGKYAITAMYSGDGGDLASTSPAVTVTVQ